MGSLEKVCVSCGRIIEMRKKWARNWENIKYCSARCRQNKHPKAYEDQILALLERRGAGKTICPSEILPPELKSSREEMELVRMAARRLVAKKLVVILQKGNVVDPSTAKGPIRIQRL